MVLTSASTVPPAQSGSWGMGEAAVPPGALSIQLVETSRSWMCEGVDEVVDGVESLEGP